MKSVGRAAIRDVLLLSFAAGSADAAGYMGLGRVFTSNMTGNLVLLGIDVGQSHFRPAVRALFVLAFFAAGILLGVALGSGVREKDWPRLASRLIGLESIALVLFAMGWWTCRGTPPAGWSYGLLALLATGMGLQSEAMNRLRPPGVATTAVTSTMTVMLSGAARLFVIPSGSETETNLGRIGFQLGVLTLYVAGAAVSGVLILRAPILLGLVPAVTVGFVALQRVRETRRT